MTGNVATTMAARACVVAFALVAALGFAEGEPEARGDRVAVVATTTIAGDIVSQIGGDQISLYVMLPVGADPHLFQPTPRDARQVADAAVVFINGGGLEAEFLGNLLTNVEPRRLVDLSSNLELRRLEDGHEHEDEHDEDEHDEDEHDEDEHDEDEHDEDEHDEDEHDEDEHDEDEHDEDEHDEDEHDEDEHDEDEHDEDEHDEDEHDEDEHEHGDFDPHVWMDPTLIAAWTPAIAAALSEVDPGSAGAYAERAAALAAELHELDAWVRERVAAVPVPERILITDHDVLGYFADRYQFSVLDTIIPGFSTASEPSARHLAALRDAISEHAVPAIFVGLTVSPRAAEVVAEDLGIKVVSIYTGSLGEPDGPAATYQDFIRTNVERIVTALGGPE